MNPAPSTPQPSAVAAAPDKANLKKIVDQISGLPTLPVVISKVTQLMQNPKVSANEVGQAISTDQALASKILKVVNSSFYGFPSRITTITHAIVILGFNSVRATALSASVFSSFGKSDRDTSFDRQGYWKHSTGVGSAAKIIARKLQIKEVEEIFLAGLMHDIGKIILDQFLHDQFEKILHIVREKKCLIIDAEKEVLGGLTHCDIGGWLGKKWNLNEEFIHIIENHHTPSSASNYFKACSIVHVANAFARVLELGSSGDNLISKINPAAWKQLNIQPETIPQLFKEIAEEVRKAEVFFNMMK
jgi:putative nucleotidyltransferase with HDIG domain